MLPDGPDRDSLAYINSEEGTTYDGEFTVKSKVFRDAITNNATHFHIWADGTRQPMTMSVVNSNEVRGWYAKNGQEIALQWPIVDIMTSSVVVSEDNTLTASTARPDLAQVPELVLDDRFHFGKFTISCGKAFYSEKYKDSVVVKYKDIKILFLDTDRETITLRTEDSGTNTLEEIPISKFFSDYSLSKHIRDTCSYFGQTAPSGPRASSYGVFKKAIPFAYSTPTVIKALLKFRRVHLRAEACKYAPEGVGFKRALETTSAQMMKKPCAAE